MATEANKWLDRLRLNQWIYWMCINVCRIVVEWREILDLWQLNITQLYHTMSTCCQWPHGALLSVLAEFMVVPDSYTPDYSGPKKCNPGSIPQASQASQPSSLLHCPSMRWSKLHHVRARTLALSKSNNNPTRTTGARVGLLPWEHLHQGRANDQVDFQGILRNFQKISPEELLKVENTSLNTSKRIP